MIYRYLNIVIRIIVLMVMTISLQMCKSRDTLEDEFKNPPGQFKPMPFWHINGELTTEGIREQMIDAKECTAEGLLHGGPHYISHGIKPYILRLTSEKDVTTVKIMLE